MKIVTIICNVILCLFVCSILVVDGTPDKAIYIIFTVLSIAIPILNVLVISRSEKNDDKIRIAAIVCNIILVGITCWALIDQYPHPEEDGIITFTILLLLTPILSAIVLLRKRKEVGKLSLS